MSVDYRGESCTYDRNSQTYSRPPVKVFRVCRHGFKRPMKAGSEPDPCPCFRCIQETNQETS